MSRITVLAAGCVLFLIALIGLGSCTAQGAWDLFGTLSLDDGTPVDPPPDPPIGPFDPSNHSYYKVLTIDNSAQTTDLMGFPVLITLVDGLADEQIDFADLNVDGSDIRFVDWDTGAELPFEIEAWNYSGTSLFWVKVPQIDGGSATDSIILYYGDTDAVSGENPAGVWDNGYVGVWHLHDDLFDATGNGNDGINNGSVDSPGHIGDGQEFDGSTSSIQIPNESNFDIAGASTLGAWARKQVATDQTIMAKTNPPSSRAYMLGYNLFGDPNGPYLVMSDDGGHEPAKVIDSIAHEAVDTWQYVVGVFTGSEVVLYVDGAEAGRTTLPQVHNNSEFLYLGAAEGTRTHLDGFMDEVRVATVARSDDWIAAQYLSMTDAFVTVGPRQIR